MNDCRRRLPITLLLVTTLAGLVSHASGPSFWTTATASEFLKGRSDGVFVSLTGVVAPGPALTSRLTTTPAQVWALVAGEDGTLWAGTGGDGRVLRSSPGQPETTVFDAEEDHVFALAAAGPRLYAATGPNGRVYVIENGAARPFFDPEEQYIWALAVDSAGALWVGAGTPAVIYRVDATGASTVVYRPAAAHVISLTRAPDGRVLAGTDAPGRLYRFDAAQKPFVLLDAGQAELRAVAHDPVDNALYAAAVMRGDDSGNTDTNAITGAAATAARDAAPPARRSILYRVDANGTWEAIWNAPDAIYDLAVDQAGLLVATGPAGRLYRVTRQRDVHLLTGVDARQITRFVTDARTQTAVAFATANPGRVIALGTGRQSAAAYLSAVHDTASASTWGQIRWESTPGVTLTTRSGNTDEPDDSWSDWSTAYTNPAGQPITSPAARFLQWRATFATPSGQATPPQLTAVTVAYLTRNSRPVVTSITVHPPGVVFQRPFVNEEGAVAGLDDATANARRPPGDPGPPTPAPGRRMFQRGLQTLAWKGADADGDDRLVYALDYRREGSSEWVQLRSGLSDLIYVWDTTTVPDGRYVVRVRAADSMTNTPDRALAGDRESDPIVVDNTPPTIAPEVVRQNGATRIQARVTDARSPIQKLEFSIDGGAWQLAYPADGLADAPTERYEIALASGVDPSRVVLRATDLLQNITTVAVSAASAGPR